MLLFILLFMLCWLIYPFCKPMIVVVMYIQLVVTTHQLLPVPVRINSWRCFFGTMSIMMYMEQVQIFNHTLVCYQPLNGHLIRTASYHKTLYLVLMAEWLINKKNAYLKGLNYGHLYLLSNIEWKLSNERIT